MTALALAVALAAAGHPCEEDAQKLCPGIEPGQGRVARCLKEHESELSSECKAKRDSFRERVSGIRDACRLDVEKFCRGTSPGGGDVADCLRQHASELSEACKRQGEQLCSLRQEGRSAMQALHEACKEDAAKFCSGVPAGGGRVARCLREHASELSSKCKGAFAEVRVDR